MSIVFDIYMFKPEFIEVIKRREAKRNPQILETFEPELGGIHCLNTVRPTPISFFTVDEALDLVHAGYQLATDLNCLEAREKSARDYSPDMTLRGTISLESDFVGGLQWEDEDKAKKFNSRQSLGQIIGSRVMVQK